MQVSKMLSIFPQIPKNIPAKNLAGNMFYSKTGVFYFAISEKYL
jgi:hypothetical protein